MQAVVEAGVHEHKIFCDLCRPDTVLFSWKNLFDFDICVMHF